MKNIILAGLVIFLSLSKPALACSCKTFTPEEIATNDNYGFTKLKINYPTAGELWQRFQKRKSIQQTYSITVLESIKGRFDYSDLLVDLEHCGISVSYGQNLYLIHSTSGTDEWGNSASVCNIKNENFAEEVKRFLVQKSLK